MINCSIHNYKEWIGAYMEGNLSREDMLTAESFLQQHPHLMDQYLLELETFSLCPHPADIPSFAELEIVITPTAHIHPNNFSDYFISYHEGLLNENEKKEVEAFLLSNPKLQTEFSVYGAAILVADTNVRYPDKTSLYKKSRPAVPLFARMAVAASIILAIGLFILWPSSQQKDGVALKGSGKTHVPPIHIAEHTPSNDPSFKQNDVLLQHKGKDHEEQHPSKKDQNIRAHTHMALVNMDINTPVLIQQASPSIEDLQPQIAMQEIKMVVPVNEDPVTDNPPRKKGLLGKLFSGEKTYIEDYVNATFTAFGDDKEDDKWVLKVDRDKEGKSKRVKFSSPLFSVKSGN